MLILTFSRDILALSPGRKTIDTSRFTMMLFLLLVLLMPPAIENKFLRSYPKPQIDTQRIRTFTPMCDVQEGEECPPNSRPRHKLQREKPLKTHVVQVYQNGDAATKRIEEYERYPTAKDMTDGGHFHLGRKTKNEFSKYVTGKFVPKKVVSTCKCGQRGNTQKIGNKIIGGGQLPAHKFISLLSLVYTDGNNHLCGGTLITNKDVLTAAHCMDGLMHDDFKVRLGAHQGDKYPNNLEPEEQVIEPQFIISHFRFSFESGNTDIAIIRLKTAAVFNRYVGTACLPKTPQWGYEKKEAIVAGWGAESVTSGVATNLPKEATLVAMNRVTCASESSYSQTMIKPRNICAKGKNGEDACQGDSGGPLYGTNSAGKDEIIGIVAWGNGCGDSNYPGVYTKIQAKQILQFIYVHTEDSEYCE